MALARIFLAAFCLCAASLSFGEETIFVPTTGIYYSTPALIENDRGLLCAGYTDRQCAEAAFIVTAAGLSNDGNFSYEIRYTINGQTCSAHVGKTVFANLGWVTVDVKTAIDCRQNQSFKPRFD